MTTVLKSTMLKALKAVKPAIAKKDDSGRTTYVLFTGKHIVSYNDSISVSSPFRTKFTGCTVNAEDLITSLSAIKEKKVDLRFNEENHLELKSDTTYAELSTDMENKEVIEMMKALGDGIDIADAKELPKNFIQGAGLCRFAASKNMATEELQHCLFIGNKKIKATDSARASLFEISEDMGEFLLVANIVPDLMKYDFVSYILQENWIHFITEDKTIFSVRLVKEEDPLDIEEFFNIEVVATLKLPSEFSDDFKNLAGMCAGETEEDLHAEVVINTEGVTIKGSKERGWITKKFIFDDFVWEGKEFTFKINPLFLSEITELSPTMEIGGEIDGDTGELEIDRAVFTSGDDEHIKFKHVLTFYAED